jgi:hypothetical protein
MDASVPPPPTRLKDHVATESAIGLELWSGTLQRQRTDPSHSIWLANKSVILPHISEGFLEHIVVPDFELHIQRLTQGLTDFLISTNR